MSDPTFSGDIMATAIADKILAALQDSHWLNEIKCFIRGGNPMPMSQDQNPFVEVIVAEENFDLNYTRGTSERTYTGIITFAMQLTKLSDADWTDVSTTPGLERQISVGSYDTIKRFIMLAQMLLSQERYLDLDTLTTTWVATHVIAAPDDYETFTLHEVVQHFRMDGQIVYGLADRGNNYENSGSIAFVVETLRDPIGYSLSNDNVLTLASIPLTLDGQFLTL